MSEPPNRCCRCGAPADRACDHLLGFAPDLDVSGAEPAIRQGMPIACDAPLCRRCGYVDAVRRDELGMLIDSIDLCPAHRDAEPGRQLLTPSAAAAARAAARLRIAPC